jgi:O-antigen/teichoic acid export membrane protein
VLENTDALLSLAEIAAAFAGFGALVSVIGRKRAKTGEAIHDLLRLRLLIATSVVGVTAALVPVGLAGYGLAPEAVWRLSSLTFLVLSYAIIAGFVNAYQPVRGNFPPDRLAVLLVLLLEVAEQVSLGMVVLELNPDNIAALYVTALIANICQAGFIFVRFVHSVFRHRTKMVSKNELRKGP